MVHAQATGASVLLFASFLLFCIGCGLPAWRTWEFASSYDNLYDGELSDSQEDLIPDQFQELALKFDCTIGSGLFQYNAHSGKCGDPEEGPDTAEETTLQITIRKSYWDSYSTSNLVCPNLKKPWKLIPQPGAPLKELSKGDVDCEKVFCVSTFRENDCEFHPSDGDELDKQLFLSQVQCINNAQGRFCVKQECDKLDLKKDIPKIVRSKADRRQRDLKCGSLRTMQAFAILAVLFSFLAFAVSAAAASGAMKNLHAPAVLALLACISGATVFAVYTNALLDGSDSVPNPVTQGVSLFSFAQSTYAIAINQVSFSNFGPAFSAEVAGFVTSAIAFLLLLVSAATGDSK